MAASKIVITGAGIMGQGLAETIATCGTEVFLLDNTMELAKKGMERIDESLNRAIRRWSLTKSEKKAILSRIIPSADLNIAKDAGLVIETIPENFEMKRDLFIKLDKICPPETIFITNAATLSITDLALATTRPDRVIGMHFLNPVPRIPLVEVIRGQKTSEETFRRAREFADLLGKTPVAVNEYPGYITTRIIVPLLNEAMFVLTEGVARPDDIDKAMKLGFGFNVGPLALADMMGLDTIQCWIQNLQARFPEKKYVPCPLLAQMIRAGHLGIKTGQGFFKYDAEGNRLSDDKNNSDSQGMEK